MNVDFVTFEYVLQIKKSQSLCQFRIITCFQKQHNLIGPQYQEFSQEVLLICPAGRGGGV